MPSGGPEMACPFTAAGFSSLGATVAAVVATMLVAPWPTEAAAAARFAAVSVSA